MTDRAPFHASSPPSNCNTSFGRLSPSTSVTTKPRKRPAFPLAFQHRWNTFISLTRSPTIDLSTLNPRLLQRVTTKRTKQNGDIDNRIGNHDDYQLEHIFLVTGPCNGRRCGHYHTSNCPPFGLVACFGSPHTPTGRSWKSNWYFAWKKGWQEGMLERKRAIYLTRLFQWCTFHSHFHYLHCTRHFFTTLDRGHELLCGAPRRTR